jgi:hypothetical protein
MPTTLSAVPELDFDGRILFWRASCSVMTFRSAAPSARHLLLPATTEVVVEARNRELELAVGRGVDHAGPD